MILLTVNITKFSKNVIGLDRWGSIDYAKNINYATVLGK